MKSRIILLIGATMLTSAVSFASDGTTEKEAIEFNDSYRIDYEMVSTDAMDYEYSALTINSDFEFVIESVNLKAYETFLVSHENLSLIYAFETNVTDLYRKELPRYHFGIRSTETKLIRISRNKVTNYSEYAPLITKKWVWRN